MARSEKDNSILCIYAQYAADFCKTPLKCLGGKNILTIKGGSIDE